MLQEQEMNVICCTISMFDVIRSWNRENIKNYREIYVKVSMEVLTKRNQKGLYSNSMDLICKDVAGIHVNVEEPKNPDIVLDNNGDVSIPELVDSILERFGER